jgi:DNA-binding NarL/FixJ family response regulator
MAPPIMRAIIVEDDRSWQELLNEILMDYGLQVDIVSSLEDAVSTLKAKPHRLAVVDLSLVPEDHNNQDGLHVLEAIHRLDPGCRSILLTGFATVELAVAALSEYGAFGFLRKESFQSNQLREIVQRAMQSAPISISESQADTTEPSIPIHAQSETSGKVLVVDDDAGWRSVLAELFTDASFQARVCSSFGEALGFLRREKFMLAVVDLSLSGSTNPIWQPPGSGQNLEGYQLLATTRTLGIPTIVVSGVASPEEIERTYAEHEIFAYLEKQAFDRSTFLQLVNEVRMAYHANREFDLLTDREREVLNLLVKGLTNKEIAEKLVITPNTVKRHLKAVFEKLGIHTRAAAVAKVTGGKT